MAIDKKKLSLTFRTLRALGFNYSEEAYGQVSILGVFGKFFGNIRLKLLQNMMDWAILEPIAPRMLRPFLVRRMGCHVGKGCFIGDHVCIDWGHADQIYIEDYVHLAGGCRVLAHKRDLTNYHVGDNAADLGYKVEPVRLCKGCQIGMESMIMPGVTVGEGAIVGAGSLISKDIPAWTIAIGRPAKVVKEVPHRITVK